MKRKFRTGFLMGIALGLLLFSMGAAPLTSTAAVTYDLSWYTFSGGGAVNSSAGNYTFGATIGQGAAGSLNGEPYTLTSGFWQPGTYNSYLAHVVR